MPTQQEVLEAIDKLGAATYHDLKEYFGMQDYRGNSNLPQRIKSLMRDGLVEAIRLGSKTIFFSTDTRIKDKEELQSILNDLGLRLKGPGRPQGTVEYRDENLLRLLKLVRERRIINYWQIRQELGWNGRTAEKYLSKLIEDGLIFEHRSGGNRLFTVSLI